MDFAEDLGIDYDNRMTKGELSDLISEALDRRESRRHSERRRRPQRTGPSPIVVTALACVGVCIAIWSAIAHVARVGSNRIRVWWLRANQTQRIAAATGAACILPMAAFIGWVAWELVTA